jgi:hypothetical protein
MPPPKSASFFALQEANDLSVEALCALFETVFGTPIRPDVWAWKYHDSALSGHVNAVLMDGDRVIAHAGAFAWPGYFRGQTVPIVQVCDLMLSPDMRGQFGPNGAYAQLVRGLTGLLKTRFPDGLFYGFPGERPFRLGERLGFYHRTGRVHEYVLPVRPGASFLWRLCALDWADPRIDPLSETLLRSSESPVIAKNRLYLDWRYRRHPVRAYILRGVRHQGRLVGWFVLDESNPDCVQVVDACMPFERRMKGLSALQTLGFARRGFREIRWWQPEDAPLPGGCEVRPTPIVAGIMTASAACFAASAPAWQPGDTDVC